ncbi:hypothetical protein [Pedobacter mucosus]|uniref:hypothetical protein n=1 Tax=Pedobacter mucosus TaxID=2895286 RepID=UPI001EE45D6B|nr:hypothetical protein [Pedobacter mucosus]UKT62718.1 hypothetical protein LOK61_13205 [Pedobacter mucosus]
MSESFANNDKLSQDLIEAKIKALATDVSLIHKHKDTNTVYLNFEDLYPQEFFTGYNLQQFICNPTELKKIGIDRDVINSVNNIVQRAEITKITSKEVVSELINWNDQDNCHGLLAFHKVTSLPESHQIVYGIQGWYEFRRFYLGEYPKTENFFIDECIKYFPKLYFHFNNRTSVGTILKSAPKKLIHHLSELNDKFDGCRTSPYSRRETIRKFNSTCRFDQDASIEGNLSRKNALSRGFTNNGGKVESVYCEIHLKLLLDDKGKVSTDRRIYFHEGKVEIEGGKILVGHIGNHL